MRSWCTVHRTHTAAPEGSVAPACVNAHQRVPCILRTSKNRLHVRHSNWRNTDRRVAPPLGMPYYAPPPGRPILAPGHDAGEAGQARFDGHVAFWLAARLLQPRHQRSTQLRAERHAAIDRWRVFVLPLSRNQPASRGARQGMQVRNRGPGRGAERKAEYA